jgi:PPOX class probable F420-dependent enzyme
MEEGTAVSMTTEQQGGVESAPAERPGFTSGYGIAAQGEGMLSWQTVTEQLTAARNYWVATTRPDGQPHVAPVWGLWLDGRFVFSTDPQSRKGQNLARRPALAVHLESGDDAVILEGTAESVHDAAFLERFADAYEAKYSFRPEPNPEAQGVYQLRPAVAFAWREQDFPNTATRWRFAAE